MKTKRPITDARNSDLRGSWTALQRAAQRARQIAARTGTAIVVQRNGKIEHIYPAASQTTPAVQERPQDYEGKK